MQNFYVTFGQKSPFRDGYVLITASDESVAREHAFYVFGEKFAFLYPEDIFDRLVFSAGQYGHTLQAHEPFKNL